MRQAHDGTKDLLSLRSARRARLEGRTDSIQPELALMSRFGSSSHPEITVIASAAKQSSARGAKLSLDCFVALRAPRNDECFPDAVNFRTRTLELRGDCLRPMRGL